MHGVEYGYLPVPHFRVRAFRTATEGGGSPGYATGKPARQDRREWFFEKAHSILHKVREIVLWGNSDSTSCQAPEVHTLYKLIHTRYIQICNSS